MPFISQFAPVPVTRWLKRSVCLDYAMVCSRSTNAAKAFSSLLFCFCFQILKLRKCFTFSQYLSWFSPLKFVMVSKSDIFSYSLFPYLSLWQMKDMTRRAGSLTAACFLFHWLLTGQNEHIKTGSLKKTTGDLSPTCKTDQIHRFVSNTGIQYQFGAGHIHDKIIMIKIL